MSEMAEKISAREASIGFLTSRCKAASLFYTAARYATGRFRINKPKSAAFFQH